MGTFFHICIHFTKMLFRFDYIGLCKTNKYVRSCWMGRVLGSWTGLWLASTFFWRSNTIIIWLITCYPISRFQVMRKDIIKLIQPAKKMLFNFQHKRGFGYRDFGHRFWSNWFPRIQKLESSSIWKRALNNKKTNSIKL